jgi:hypothetical protein
MFKILLPLLNNLLGNFGYYPKGESEKERKLSLRLK